MNPIMIDTLRHGGRLTVEIAIEAHIEIGGCELAPLDLTQKAGRVLVERAAEVAERQNEVPVLNR